MELISHQPFCLNRSVPVKLIVMGPAGKMGRAMAKIATARPGMELAGAVGPAGRDYIGRDMAWVCGLDRETGISVSDNLESVIHDGDMVVDCTGRDAAMAALDICARRNTAFVSGTTGFSREDMEAFKRAGERIPVLWAGNTSRMVRLLFRLIEAAARALPEQGDIDITDIHGRDKADAPSGTSLEIANILEKTLRLDREKDTFGRQGNGVRKKGSIAFNSVRSGNEPFSIGVSFGFEDECLELKARAHNMNTYARGMIDAALFLEGKPPGYYTIGQAFEEGTDAWKR